MSVLTFTKTFETRGFFKKKSWEYVFFTNQKEMSWNQPRGPGGWTPYGYGPPMGGNYNSWGMPPGPRGAPPGFGGPMRPQYWGPYGGVVSPWTEIYH